MLRIGTFAGSVVIGLAFLVFAQETLPKGGDDGKKTEATSRSALARKALAERIEVPEEFRKQGQPSPFRFVLSYIDGALADRKQSLQIVVDQASFREANQGDPLEILETVITFSPFLKTATVQEMLEYSLKQVPTGNATYLVKNGNIEILTHDAANINVLLDQGIAIQFRELPLKLAIDDLADRTGFTVMIDPRCVAVLNNSVSLQSQNDISPRGILSSWADMFDLKLLVDEHRVMLMPRGDYLKKLSNQVDEEKALSQIFNFQYGVPGGGGTLVGGRLMGAIDRQRGRKAQP